LPRILLVIDEFHDLFAEEDAVSMRAAQIIDHLVREGRSFGMHVLLASQTLAGIRGLFGSTKGQMGVRIALQCSDADSREILADDNPAARQLSRPGEAIYNDNSGLVESNTHFQVAYIDEEQLGKYLAEIEALAADTGYEPPRPQIVFEGNAPAHVASNEALLRMLSEPRVQPRPRAWIGEPIEIREPVYVEFRRQPGDNLLIIGQNEAAARGISACSLVSLATQTIDSSDPARHSVANVPAIYVVDLSSIDQESPGPLEVIASLWPHVALFRRARFGYVLREIAAEVQRRLDAEEYGAPSRFLFVYGLQRARDLVADDLFYAATGPNGAEQGLAEQLASILRQGPDVCVHVVAWCDTVTNLSRRLNPASVRECGMRIAMQMGVQDSTTLIDSLEASRLGPYRAIFYHETESRVEKFRPYDVPETDWLKSAVPAWCRILQQAEDSQLSKGGE